MTTTRETPLRPSAPPAAPAAPLGEPRGDTAVSARGLRRRYGGPDGFEAVRGLDLDVPRGCVMALLGVNGAGKTSALEVIEGLAPATGGAVRVLGLDPVADRRALRPRLGVLLQTSGLPGDLTVLDVLRMWAGTLSRPRPLGDVLDEMALTRLAGTRVVALSGGERRRLDLACTLLGSPELVVLDEPTTGLDPESRRRVWGLITALRDAGGTVLLSTHHLEEAEALADQVALMATGRIVRVGTLAEIVADQPSVVRYRVVGEPGVRRLETREPQADLLRILAAAEREGVRLEDLEVRAGTLEQVFLDVARDAREEVAA
ncbi:ABC transporter ATP-binding protein [Nocardioides sp. TRM66260-LWL]|uniref:ABC transporter ATP-binding protein n=1 Tax=Nocardioides sp. TRM66260-LWL TaxID=2874478 RepID=UPI001CC7E766|nr:ABC transporter ATP-binding protein [Nocardioides sp. TRM66260-LWL]MBZ5733085.1 ABC transporter ATP-binding protein [Nocardioides sp. TRM66260-LWL]